MRNDERWFKVEGIVVGWLRTGSNGDEVYEDEVAIVQQDNGLTFIRWLGNDYTMVDPPEAQEAAIGARIGFTTTMDEQLEYTKIARGRE